MSRSFSNGDKTAYPYLFRVGSDQYEIVDSQTIVYILRLNRAKTIRKAAFSLSIATVFRVPPAGVEGVTGGAI